MEPYIDKREHIKRVLGPPPSILYIFSYIRYTSRYKEEEIKFEKYWNDQWITHCHNKDITDPRTFYKCGKIREVLNNLYT